MNCDEDIIQVSYNQEIAPAIAASPKLTWLCLRTCGHTKHDSPITETCTSLRALLGDPTGPRLTELELQHIPISSASLKQPLSHKLKSLTISTSIGSRRLKFAWAELFTTLKKSGVELSLLSVIGMEAAMDQMLSYLSS